MFESLQGQRTYIMAGAIALYAVLGLIIGDIDANTAIQRIMEALTVVFMRKAIS